MDSSQHQTVNLLVRVADGDEAAGAELFHLVESELRAIAGRIMQRERADHTLQATALIDDVYMKLVGSRIATKDRGHFIDIAARAMRRTLVDHARKRAAARRGGGRERVTLSGVGDLLDESGVDVLALEEALEELGILDERKARVVELRFYGGMTTNEVAALLDVSPKTAEADWYMARAWLWRALSA